MTISYFISVPSFKSTAFVVWILARGAKFKPPAPCFSATSEPPCTIGLMSQHIRKLGTKYISKTIFMIFVTFFSTISFFILTPVSSNLHASTAFL